jgi:hypothetical protein
MQNNYSKIISELLHGMNFVERDRYSKDDFVMILCPEHGAYYKTVQDVLNENPECPACNYLNPSKSMQELLEVTSNPEQEPDTIFYRLKVEHKRTGLIFQKIGISKNSEDFDEFWNPYKWKDFIITPIVKIACSSDEAQELQRTFQENNQDSKITIPNELKFNMNKTYAWHEIWQAKSKTIPILRDIMLQKQKGLCTICNKPVKAPTLDHMHIKKVRGTGYIRAVCCSQCNTFIARSENNAMRHGISNQELPDVLRRMADHLENQTRIIHPTEVPKRKKVGTREWNKVKKHYLKVFPRRKTIPDKPTYVTDSWLELKQAVDDYISEEVKRKEEQRRIRQELKKGQQ